MSQRQGPAWPSGTSRLAAVIGDPVRHSLSPAIHNAAFESLELDWVYVAFEVPAGQGGAAVDAMRALGIDGLSVTMPHKAEVMGALDRLTSTASALGAVNTVVRLGDELVGESTDGAGFLDSLRDCGFDPRGRRCLLVGAGGAARAVVRALAEAGAAEVVVVNRSPARAEAVLGLAPDVVRVGTAEAADGAELVVNATPLGMGRRPRPGAEVNGGEPSESEDELPVDPSRLGPGQLVVDLVYHPAVTPFLEAARERGAVAVNGLGMLIHQAAYQFRLWTGEDPPLEVMSAAAAAELTTRG